MISPARNKINDMSMWLGTEAPAYAIIAKAIEDIEILDQSGNELAGEWMKAFNLVHATMKKALELG